MTTLTSATTITTTVLRRLVGRGCRMGAPTTTASSMPSSSFSSLSSLSPLSPLSLPPSLLPSSRKLSPLQIRNISSTRRTPMAVVTLKDEGSIEKFRVLNTKSILYFTATWCPPCKSIGPVYDQLSDRHPDIAFGKVDVDDNSDAALDFEVSAVPTFVLFHGENAIGKFSGADPVKLADQVSDLDGR